MAGSAPISLRPGRIENGYSRHLASCNRVCTWALLRESSVTYGASIQNYQDGSFQDAGLTSNIQDPHVTLKPGLTIVIRTRRLQVVKAHGRLRASLAR